MSVGLVLFNTVMKRTGGKLLYLSLTKYSTGAGILGSHPTLEWDVYFCKKRGLYKDWKLVSMCTGAGWTCEALCASSLAAVSRRQASGEDCWGLSLEHVLLLWCHLLWSETLAFALLLDSNAKERAFLIMTLRIQIQCPIEFFEILLCVKAHR